MTEIGTPRVLDLRALARPVPPVAREVLGAAGEADFPPLVLVHAPGQPGGASVFAEVWLPLAAAQGLSVYAVSLRGHGGTPAAGRADVRAYAHDVVQVAAGLPRRAILIGWGGGSAVVQRALTRYSAVAAVLVAPVPPGRWTRHLRRPMEPPAGSPRVLAVGSPDDRTGAEATRLAGRYAGTPLFLAGNLAAARSPADFHSILAALDGG